MAAPVEGKKRKMADNRLDDDRNEAAGGHSGPRTPSGIAAAMGDAQASGAPQAATTVDSVNAATETAIEEARKKRAGKRRTGIAVAAVVAALLAIYLGGAAWFSGHFLPNTNIGSYDISGMDVDEAAAMLDAASGDYALSVTGEGLDFQVTSEDTGLRIDSQRVVQKAIDANEPWTWPVHIASSDVQDLTGAMQVTFDEDGFSKFVKRQVKALNKTAEDPTPATIAYKKKEGAFVVVPEELGTKLSSKAVLAKVEDAAYKMLDSVEVGEDELLRPKLLADDERLAKAVDAANDMLGADIQLTLGGNDWTEVGKKTIASWIELGDDVVPALSEKSMRAWVDKKVPKVNSIGTKRSFTTPRGDKVEIEGGSYGWQVDPDAFYDVLKQAVADKVVGTLDVPCLQYAASVPDKNGIDFGSRYVDVNLSTQHAVFYDGKDVLWESDFISGSPDGEHNTPTGVYMINLKESPSKLVGEMQPVEVTTGKGKRKTTYIDYQPEYETTVQYWMPFVGNAVGFHDATWQPGFGGSMYAEGYGSHGCINLPYEAAEALYGVITEYTPVISHG